MNHTTVRFRLFGKRAIFAAVAAMALTGAQFASAQAAKSAKPAPAPRVVRAAPKIVTPRIEGLDGLDDGALGAE
ncbi:MAG TPA: hypothetical protein VFC46_15555, partial [Humisphaera sp.]|nr:hypothetical protein [Humisphaera sp.]